MSADNDTLNSQLNKEISRRPRSATLLCLKMFADMFKKTNDIKSKVSNGNYNVNSEEVAKSLLNKV